MGANPHAPQHQISDAYRHQAGTASSFVRTNSGATAVEEVAGATAATASTVMLRDSSGRSKVADPSASGDIATKNYVDTQDSHALNSADHTFGTTPLALVRTDGAGTGIEETVPVSTATASTIIVRDASARAAVADPSASGDIATKNYVDTQDSHALNSADHTFGTTPLALVRTDGAGTGIEETVPVSTATASTIIVRDSNARAAVADPSASGDIATKNYVDTGAYLAAALIAQNLTVLGHHVRTVTTADMVTTGLSEVIDVATDDDSAAYPAGTVVGLGFIELDIPISGGTISAVVAKLGDAGADDELTADVSVFTGATPGIVGTPLLIWSWEATAYAPICTLTFTGGNSDTATAGQLKTHILYFGLADLLS